MKINTEKCKPCEGKGFIHTKVFTESFGNLRPTEVKKRVYENILCPKCRGWGKVDWVSRVTDYQEPEIPLLKEATKEVQELIKKDEIFGGDSITILDRRRAMIKKFKMMEEKKNGNK
jgi:RecJ-like exonuclease